jgi:hypothetical protein
MYFLIIYAVKYRHFLQADNQINLGYPNFNGFSTVFLCKLILPAIWLSGICLAWVLVVTLIRNQGYGKNGSNQQVEEAQKSLPAGSDE